MKNIGFFQKEETMFKKKLIAMGLIVAMIGSLVACGGEDENANSENKATPTTAVGGSNEEEVVLKNASDDHSSIDAGSIVSFEDDNTSFVTLNDGDWTGDDDSVMSVATKYDSKVLHITRPNGGVPAVAIDIVSLLGDNAANCTKITLDIGIDCLDGFSACSGTATVFAGELNSKIETSWSIYKADAAMKTVTIDLGENVLAAGYKNYLAITSIDDTAVDFSPVFIDNIIFYDASGNALAVDTSVDFAVSGVGEYDWSNAVKQPTDEVFLFAGVQQGTGWWPDKNNSFNFYAENANCAYYFDSETVTFGPGDVLTIYYTMVDPSQNTVAPSQSVPYIRMQNYKNVDADGNELADDGSGWYGGAVDIGYQESVPGPDSEYYMPFKYDHATATDLNLDEDRTPSEIVPINESYSIVQYSYEYIVASLEAKGFNADNWTLDADMIGIADRGLAVTIDAVTIGKAAE